MLFKQQIIGGLIMLKILERSGFISADEYNKITECIKENEENRFGKRFMKRVIDESEKCFNKCGWLED